MENTLRPMSTGEVLDRTFGLYRRNFVLFFGIALLAPALLLVAKSLPLAATLVGGSIAETAMAASGIAALVILFAYFLGIVLAQAATIYAVSAVHLGRPTGIAASYGQVRGKLLRVLGVGLSVGIRSFGLVILGFLLLAVGIPASSALLKPAGVWASIVLGILAFGVMVACLVGGMLLYLRYAVAVQACVLENLKVGNSLKRSAVLTRGDRGRIFVITFLVGVLSYVLSITLVVPVSLLSVALRSTHFALGQFLSYLMEFLAGSLVGPIGTIAISLVYYDERVRKEAFDLQLMMSSLDSSIVPTSTPAPANPVA